MAKEKLRYSDFIRHRRVSSRISLGHDVISEEEFFCPRCRFTFPEAPRHGVRDRCLRCKLALIVWGNSLEVDDGSVETESEKNLRVFDQTAVALAKEVLESKGRGSIDREAVRALMDRLTECL